MANNRVAQLSAIGKIDLIDNSLPELSSDQLLVEIKACGLCGSDLHYFDHGGLGTYKLDMPMHNTGHEPAGIIVDNNGNSDFKVGDRVGIEPGCPDLRSKWSLRGKHNLCSKGTFLGSNISGAFCDYLSVLPIQLQMIPDEVSFEVATLIEPLGVALHCLNLLKPTLSDSVTIFGSGPIGLCLLYLFKKMGINRVFMVDKLEYRLVFSRTFGAYEAFEFSKELKEQIGSLSELDGTSIVIDAAGTQESVEECINVCSIGGKIAFVGIPIIDHIKINPHRMRTKELKIINVRRANQTLDDCVRLLSEDHGIFETMISHTFSLKQIQKAFENNSAYADSVIKTVIKNR